MDLQERAHLQALIDTKQRRLRVLEERAAKQGYNTPPEVTLEIRDLQSEIQQHERERNGSLPQQQILTASSSARPISMSRFIAQLFAVIGGIASIIGILVFVTGRADLSSFIGAGSATATPTVVATGPVGASAATPIALAVATAVPIATPLPLAAANVATAEVAAAPTYPCEATITNKRGDVVDTIRQFPNEGSNKQPSLNAGTPVVVQRTSASSNDWLEIANRDGLELGWILREYLVLAPSCPL